MLKLRLYFSSNCAYNTGNFIEFCIQFSSVFLRLLNFKTLRKRFIIAAIFSKNAQKVNFPQIATITKGTFLTFLIDNLVCFNDYRAKKLKKMPDIIGAI